MRYIVLSAALILSACNPAQKAQVTNDISAAEVALTGAERLALIYTKSAVADPVIVAKIKSLDNTAYNSVKAAENNSGAIADAVSAISTLQSAIPQ